MLAAEEQYEELLTYIGAVRSLDLLQMHDELLLKCCQSEFYELYKNLLTDYLNNHLGRKPSVKTREIIAHLFEINAGRLAEKLMDYLRKNYADRQSLMEELRGVFVIA